MLKLKLIAIYLKYLIKFASTLKRKTMTPNEEFLHARVKALENELKRVNEEGEKVKAYVNRVSLTDPNFYKPLSEIEVNYE